MGKKVILPGRVESAEVGGVVAGANTILDEEKGKRQNVINSEVSAELVRLNESKQDNLTFDNAPTEGSQNPVTSGGVYTADKALSDAIEAILLLIPSAASVLNKLVDLSTMNSSIATATASFKGTYNLVSDLHLTVSATHAQIAAALDALSLDADNNDYAFVQVPNMDTAPTEIKKTERYKFNGTNWAYEYDLNNSGFTSAQWNAINSGITVLLVSKLLALPTNEALMAALEGKQDNLTFDNVPTAGSQNPVKSGGIYTRNNEIVAMINALDEAKQDVLTFDSTPTSGSTNPVTSAGVYLAISLVQAAVVALDGRMSTAETKIGNAETNIVNLQAAYAALTQSDIVVVEGALPSTGQQQNVIYRQPDQEHTPPQFYSDYLWNGTSYVLMATYNNAIDDEPTAGSDNLVKSGGVYSVWEYPYTNHGYLNESGVLVTNIPDSSHWYATDFVEVSPKNKYKIKAAMNAHEAQYIAFYDKDKTFISGLHTQSGDTEMHYYTGEIPEYCRYVRGCAYFDSGEASFAIVADKGVPDAVNYSMEFSNMENRNSVKFIIGCIIGDTGLYKKDSKHAMSIGYIADNDVKIEVNDGYRIEYLSRYNRETLEYVGYTGVYAPSYKIQNLKNEVVRIACKKVNGDDILESELDDIIKDIYLADDEIEENPTFDLHGYINTDGDFVEVPASTPWNSTDFIPVIGGFEYKVTVYAVENSAIIAFYNKEKTAIDVLTGSTSDETKETRSGIVPDEAFYVRSCTFGGHTNEVVFNLNLQKSEIIPYLARAGKKTDYTTRSYIDFTVPVNQYIVDNSDTRNTLIDNESDIIDVDCILKLPSSYTPSGNPCKLVMICHGAGQAVTSWKNNVNYNRIVTELNNAGYAIFDCNGYSNQTNGFNFWGAPRGVIAYRKAYSYIVDRYNVEKDVYIYGFSMGGLAAMNLVLNSFPNVKCIALGSPVLDLYKCFVERQSDIVAAYGYNTWVKELYAGNDPMLNIITENSIKYFRKQIPPLKIWYGGLETNGYSDMTFVEKEDAKSIVTAIQNSDGTAYYREIAGAGHEICYGGNVDIVKEIRMFIDRY